jgi:sarcosine oxidase subunit gamma
MDEIAGTNALAGRKAGSPAGGYTITFREVTDRGMIDVRGRGGDKKFLAVAKDVLGIALPASPRTSAGSGDVTALWLSIDQWLITLPLETCAQTLEALRKATSRLHVLATDLSDARTVIRLEGDNVREVLMKGTSVDFTLPGFGAGTVRRMLFAEIAAMAHIVGTGPDVVDLYVFRSYADYAWEWLEATAGENARVTLFGVQDPPPT